MPDNLEGLKERPEADNLVGIYAALQETNKQSVIDEFGDKEFSTFKPALAELAVEKLAPINEEMKRLMAAPADVDAILRNGADRARVIADQTMAEVKQIAGFLA